MSKILSAETIETIKATIPFLEENGIALTEHFYKRLFNAVPEVKAFFNSSNQSSGVQQGALGGAICAFAQNIETPEALSEAVIRIANKHASLGVKPEHYPIVGEHLLGSINDLLNPAPTEILKAWEEAYQFLAKIFIDVEEGIYQENLVLPGGWSGFKELEVVKKVKESDLITSFYLKSPIGEELPVFRAGQYITVRVPTQSSGCPINGVGSTMRNYSLSGSPGWSEYRISVKREEETKDKPAGYVSNYLYENVTEGDRIEVGQACGDFFLADHTEETPILLLSAGVGQTPLAAMLHATKSNYVSYIHIAKNGKNHALRDELEQLASESSRIKYHVRYTDVNDSDRDKLRFHSEGYLTPEFLKSFLTLETEVYFCGPKAMMKSVLGYLKELGHPNEKVHYEFFGPS